MSVDKIPSLVFIYYETTLLIPWVHFEIINFWDAERIIHGGVLGPIP